MRVTGSAYRRPGARMLIDPSGESVGMVSGGCLENDLQQRAAEVLASERPRTVVYDMRSPDDIVWGLGLGCDGEVRVLLERIDPQQQPPWMQFAALLRRERRYGAVATLCEEGPLGPLGQRWWMDEAGEGELIDEVAPSLREALQAGHSCAAQWGESSGFIERIQPAVSLVIFGAGNDAEPLVQQARALDWQVRCFDQREETPVKAEHLDYRTFDVDALALDRRSAVVLMTHHFLHDQTLLERLAEQPLGFLGLLGPRRRKEKMLESLSLSSAALETLHAPVGLDIGSETPQEIALSILSEIQARLAGRDGGSLRLRDAPLHDWPR